MAFALNTTVFGTLVRISTTIYSIPKRFEYGLSMVLSRHEVDGTFGGIVVCFGARSL